LDLHGDGVCLRNTLKSNEGKRRQKFTLPHLPEMLTLRNEFVPKEKKLTPKFIAHMATCIDAAEQKVFWIQQTQSKFIQHCSVGVLRLTNAIKYK